MADQKVELIPRTMAGAPIEEQFPVAMARLGDVLDGLKRHQSGIEDMLEGNGKPGFKSMQEYQVELRKVNPIENVRWAADFRTNINKILWRIAGSTVVGGGAAAYLVIRLHEAGVL